MKYLIKNATIRDPRSPFSGQKVDFILHDGKIEDVGTHLKASSDIKEISAKDLVLIPTLVDIYATSGDLDCYEAESIPSLLGAASQGGVGLVGYMPSKQAPIIDKSTISYIQSFNSNSLSQIIPFGNMYEPSSGNLTPMMEMTSVGAMAFVNGTEPMDNVELAKKALLYSKGNQGRMLFYVEKKQMTRDAQMNEGQQSVSMGLLGADERAEIMAVQELLDIIDYTSTEAVIYGLSSPESIELIHKFNKSTKRVWAAISSFHLLFDDSFLDSFDTNYKVWPPLRAKNQVKKLRKQVMDKKVDIIYSQHIPLTPEQKNIEFDYAQFGTIHIQTSLLTAMQALQDDDFSQIVETMSLNPANALNITLPIFDKGADACFTLIDKNGETIFNRETNCSKSYNSPLLNQTLKGRVLGLAHGGKQAFF